MKSRASLLRLALVALAAIFHGVHAKISTTIASQQAFRPSSLRTDADFRVEKSPFQVPRAGGSSRETNAMAGALGGVIAMGLIEKATKEGLRAAHIQFPSQLAGCAVLFAFLLLAEAISPDLANGIFNSLAPGAGILAKWLPVFFVPGLAMLPLAPSMGSGIEIAKVFLTVIVGLVYSLFTTTLSVAVYRKAQGSYVRSNIPSTVSPLKKKGPTRAKVGLVPVTPVAAVAKPYSAETMSTLTKLTAVSAVASAIAIRSSSRMAVPLRTCFFFFSTFAAYVWGARLPSSITKVVHPLVTSSGLVLLAHQFMAYATGSTMTALLRTYKVNSLDLMRLGAGDIMMYLLGPSVVSFAIAMYSRRALIKSNLAVIVMATLVASAGGLYGTAAFVRAIALGGRNGSVLRLSSLTRNVTTALAMAVTEMLGGNISICAIVVVMTGILGATYGKTMLDAFGIVDPVCRGLGIGGSSQGLGVASLSSEPEAFPFAAISMVLTAMFATTLVSFPAVRDSLISLATGDIL